MKQSLISSIIFLVHISSRENKCFSFLTVLIREYHFCSLPTWHSLRHSLLNDFLHFLMTFRGETFVWCMEEKRGEKSEISAEILCRKKGLHCTWDSQKREVNLICSIHRKLLENTPSKNLLCPLYNRCYTTNKTNFFSHTTAVISTQTKSAKCLN